MKTIVNEPLAEYRISGWIEAFKELSFDECICGIEDKKILFCSPSGSTSLMFSVKPKAKLSDLRGKMTKQSEKEIDDQISDLRNEWDRNI